MQEIWYGGHYTVSVFTKSKSEFKPAVLALIAVLFFSCLTPYQQVGRQPLSGESKEQPAVIKTEEGAESVSFIVQFTDSEDREGFIQSFNRFLIRSPYEFVLLDSGKDFVHIKVSAKKVPVVPPKQEESLGFSPVEPFKFDESFIEQMIPSVDTTETDTLVTGVMPARGGEITLYSPRSFTDRTIMELLNGSPFDGEPGLFTITDSSRRRVELQLNGRVVNGAGEAVSALDLIQSWTAMIRELPAEGIALFRHVQGVEAFIRGEEPVIRGFYAVDRNTLQLRMAQPDPHAVKRLHSSRLLWSGLKLGPYYTQGTGNGNLRLMPNDNSRGGSEPYLEKCYLRLGGDSNPMLSFSLGRIGAATLYSSADLQYARTNLAGSTTLHRLPSERYFVSSRIENPDIRKFVAKQVRAIEFLNSFVKAEGEVIASVELADYNNDHLYSGVLTQPAVQSPLQILFVDSDPVSKSVAEKMFADITHSGIRAQLNGISKTDYQRALVAGSYDLAIGWAYEDVLTDQTEQLRVAAIWFDDNSDAAGRVEQYREVPLFSVDRFLLTSNEFKLHEGRVGGIFTAWEQETVQQDLWQGEIQVDEDQEEEDIIWDLY